VTDLRVSAAADTIVAISTAAGRGLRGIVRLSGGGACARVGAVFRASSTVPSAPFERGYRVHRGELVFPGDEVAIPCEILVMLAPASYTREDVVEIHTFGVPALLERIVEGFVERGVRIAEPGEFTRRAFLRGRIDLTQVESVLEILRAADRRELDAAVRRHEGSFGRSVASVREALLRLAAGIEAHLDFSDQGLDLVSAEEIRSDCEAIRERIDALQGGSPPGGIRSGAVTALFLGAPNAGKSSLFNALVGSDRAVVSEIPGTTLDPVEAEIEIDGIPIRLVDAPGLGPIPTDALEREAADRVRGWEEGADLAVLVVDGSRPVPGGVEEIFRRVAHLPGVLAVHQADRAPVLAERDLERLAPGRPRVATSSVSGVGLAGVRAELARLVRESSAGGSEGTAVPNARHAALLESAHEAVARAGTAAGEGLPLECVALEIREAAESLGAITGEEFKEGLLDRVFAEFCIGK